MTANSVCSVVNLLEQYLAQLNIKHPSKQLVCGCFYIKILTNNKDKKRLTLINIRLTDDYYKSELDSKITIS